ncbi:fucolectin-6-like [Mixophyes fleayi]|uniref:fucolectin-6-like n=1 Tax=Mixophyes fleayi TaxID=3061075 RepID=UPI003F4DDE52
MDLLVALALLVFLGLSQSCPNEEIATNIARSGTASESSNFYDRTASNAIDGNYDTNENHVHCSSTNQEYQPWWRLDLNKSYYIVKVVIIARTDAYTTRLLGAELRIGNSPDNNNPVFGTVTSVSNNVMPYCCNGTVGRYVSVVIPGRSELLTLCEVEVYALGIPPC